MKEGQRRIYLLDELRGFAIICMVIHHTFYDIGFVLHYDIATGSLIFYASFSPCSGQSSSLPPAFAAVFPETPCGRGAIVFAAGLAVTLVTAAIMPAIGITGAEIYFGVLSCLGLSMIITGAFLPLINKLGKKGSIAGHGGLRRAFSCVVFH